MCSRFHWWFFSCFVIANVSVVPLVVTAVASASAVSTWWIGKVGQKEKKAAHLSVCLLLHCYKSWRSCNRVRANLKKKLEKRSSGQRGWGPEYDGLSDSQMEEQAAEDIGLWTAKWNGSVANAKREEIFQARYSCCYHYYVLDARKFLCALAVHRRCRRFVALTTFWSCQKGIPHNHWKVYPTVTVLVTSTLQQHVLIMWAKKINSMLKKRLS